MPGLLTEIGELMTVYSDIIGDVLDIISEMRDTGDFDENTLETIEWRLK